VSPQPTERLGEPLRAVRDLRHEHRLLVAIVVARDCYPIFVSCVSPDFGYVGKNYTGAAIDSGKAYYEAGALSFAGAGVNQRDLDVLQLELRLLLPEDVEDHFLRDAADMLVFGRVMCHGWASDLV
jgi:hypothetical protein